MNALTKIGEGGDKPPLSFNLPEIGDTQATVGQDVCTANHKINRARGYPDLFDDPETGKYKAARVAICGGGPSVADHVDEIMSHDVIVACGTAHQFFIDRGIVPTYATSCDGHESAKKYYGTTFPETTYLLATNCEPVLFDMLEGRKIVTWHCLGAVEPVECERHWISGGSTITSRTINMFMVMGFLGLDVYGYDLSFRGDKQHAYETPEDECTRFLTAKVDGSDRLFQTSIQFYREMQFVRMMYEAFWHAFDIRIHGDGMLPEWMKMMKHQQENAT